MTASPRPHRLVVETREIDHVEELIAQTDAATPLFWQRRGDGMAGFGEVLRIEVGTGPDGGPSRSTALAQAWRDVASVAEVDDAVQIAGTGLVGFGAFVFDERSAAVSTLIVPSVIIGRRDSRSWVTRIHDADAAPGAGEAPAGPGRLGTYWSATLGPGAMDPEGYRSAVATAVARIRAGEFDKAVLARDLVGSVPAGADLRRLVRALATDYPDCWTYAVDGIVGASPETLVTVSGGTVSARVLAGTVGRGVDSDDDTRAQVALATSAKDLEEHRYAVQSVVAALRPHTSALAAADEPFTLKLPNLWHLATDVEGVLSGAASALDLVATLHPTAAVAGTPTLTALDVIRELEPFDRGRYAGPVGWVDAGGDGEWAIALRCAQFGPAGEAVDDAHPDARPVVAHAGAGIVAGSDPETELLETRVKFRPIVDALA
ncbi:isochorismate synthase [Microbacterium allomyrinae]|uniref:isochorismate synthase n=1 Tax=Microbacterium allomyrinae TaxID=2830666 RepID=A0A9X1LTA1_9MICO|nr:isochorismate synthase [Microbacterium allomyrinae]MCC2031296.1 isochorismate synthase [Microbacterium allomyrinae]